MEVTTTNLEVVNTILQFGLVVIAFFALRAWRSQLRGTTDFNIAHEALVCAIAAKLAWASAAKGSRKPRDFAPGIEFWKWADIQSKLISDRTDEERLYCAKALDGMFRIRFRPIQDIIPELQRHAATVVTRWPELESVVKDFLWSVQYFQIVSEGLIHNEIQGHNWPPEHKNQTHEDAFRLFLEPSFRKLDEALRTHL